MNLNQCIPGIAEALQPVEGGVWEDEGARRSGALGESSPGRRGH